MSSASNRAPNIVVVGTGRLGTVMARALAQAGADVRGSLGHGEEIHDADIALLCVPDTAIPDAAVAARGHAALVGHVSGATGLEDVDFSIHPLQTFTGAESPEVFHGIGAAVDGRTDDALAAAERLASTLGAHPFRVIDAVRAESHAAASMASNFVLTVLDAAERLAVHAGLPSDARDLIAPLVQQTIANWADRGASAVLTGPIARGDEATVTRQRAAVDAATPDLLPLFDQLVDRTRELAARDITTTELVA